MRWRMPGTSATPYVHVMYCHPLALECRCLVRLVKRTISECSVLPCTPPSPCTCTAHYRGGPIVQLQCCVLRVGPCWCTRQCALPCGGMSQGICALQRATIHLRFAGGVVQLLLVEMNVTVCICRRAWASLEQTMPVNASLPPPPIVLAS
jgi:hypothetical protein